MSAPLFDRLQAGLMARPWLRNSVLCFAMFIGLVVARHVFCTFVRMASRPAESSFSERWWKWGITCRCTPIRQQMAPDLIASGRLIGLARADVVALLGPPARNPRVKGGSPRHVSWRLGLARSLFGDDEWLLLELDERDVVVNAKLAED